MVMQSVKPSEVLLVRDGKVPEELEILLNEYENRYTEVFQIVRLEENGGGNALKLGVEMAKDNIYSSNAILLYS